MTQRREISYNDLRKMTIALSDTAQHFSVHPLESIRKASQEFAKMAEFFDKFSQELYQKENLTILPTATYLYLDRMLTERNVLYNAVMELARGLGVDTARNVDFVVPDFAEKVSNLTKKKKGRKK